MIVLYMLCFVTLSFLNIIISHKRFIKTNVKFSLTPSSGQYFTFLPSLLTSDGQKRTENIHALQINNHFHSGHCELF